jgi:GNAT superfamily N-acetyltransferase
VTTIAPLEPAHRAGVLAVAARLPEWFTTDGRRKLAVDLEHQAGLVALAAGAVVGFATWFVYEATGHLAWMGVDPDHHRRGTGRRLIDAAAARLAPTGVTALEVDTLGDAVDYEPYEGTRRFYRACGFELVRVVDQDDPEWPQRLVLGRRLTVVARS